MRRVPSRSQGLTLLEVVLALALLGVVAYQAVTVFGSAARATTQDTATTLLEDQADVVLERIALAVMGSSRESLQPAIDQPASSDEIQYQVHLGVEDGVVVWGDPELIGLDESDASKLYWAENPAEASARRVVWTQLVRPYLEGELPNGMDDNSNGLIDEKGLSFALDRNAVTIRLTLETPGANGELLVSSVETTVTCRHIPEENDALP